MPALAKSKTVDEISVAARNIVAVIMDRSDLSTGQSIEETKLLLDRPDKTEEEIRSVVFDMTQTILYAKREGLSRTEIEERVALEIMWLGYCNPIKHVMAQR